MALSGRKSQTIFEQLSKKKRKMEKKGQIPTLALAPYDYPFFKTETQKERC